MVKVKLNRTVKYNGVIYRPNTVFEANEKDLDELKKIGAFVIEEPKEEAKSIKSVEVVEEDEEEVAEVVKQETSRRNKKRYR